MLTIIEVLETFKFKIAEGSRFMWDCYGPSARVVDFTDDLYPVRHSACCTFDNSTGEVYQLDHHDYLNKVSYRWMNPVTTAKYIEESTRRRCLPNEAYDNVEFTPCLDEYELLKTSSDLVLGNCKSAACEIVEVELDSEVLFALMTTAHDRDITLNQLVSEVLRVKLGLLK